MTVGTVLVVMVKIKKTRRTVPMYMMMHQKALKLRLRAKTIDKYTEKDV
jgi:hypothetical protein